MCQPSPPPLFLHACSESEGREEVLTFFVWRRGGGGYFDCLYLSGVNFQALSSFWACSSLSLVCSSSAFILRKNKLMAGSTMDDRSWAALGCWTCLRYWIWVYGIKQTSVRKLCDGVTFAIYPKSDLVSFWYVSQIVSKFNTCSSSVVSRHSWTHPAIYFDLTQSWQIQINNRQTKTHLSES